MNFSSENLNLDKLYPYQDSPCSWEQALLNFLGVVSRWMGLLFSLVVPAGEVIRRWGEGRRTLTPFLSSSILCCCELLLNLHAPNSPSPEPGHRLAMAASQSVPLLAYLQPSCLHTQTGYLEEGKSSRANLHVQLGYLYAKKSNLHLFSCSSVCTHSPLKYGHDTLSWRYSLSLTSVLCSCSLLVFCKHILTYGVYFHLGQGDAEEIKHWENELQRMGCSDSAELPLNSSMGISALPLFAYPCPAGIKLLDDVDWHSLYQETCGCFAVMHVNVLPLCIGFLSGVGTRIEKHRTWITVCKGLGGSFCCYIYTQVYGIDFFFWWKNDKELCLIDDALLYLQMSLVYIWPWTVSSVCVSSCASL